jgi:L-lactate dehydrogenase (cytochrome)
VAAGAIEMTAIQAGRTPSDASYATVRKRRKVNRRLAGYLSLNDFEAVARHRLPRMLYGFISGGAETNSAVRANTESFQDYCFVPRALTDVSKRSHRKTLFGRSYAAPFGIAPTGVASICAYRSDLVTARCAAAAEIPTILSATSLIPMEEVRSAGQTTWYQAYIPGNPQRIEPLIERVAAAGFDTFVVTVDVPVPANRENNTRNGFSIPINPSAQLIWQGLTHPSWLIGTFMRTFVQHGVPHIENMDATRGPPILSREFERAFANRDQLSWEHVKLIRKRWRGPLVIKGLLSAADARTAKNCGIDGIIVSNHGGRQLDCSIAPLRALPPILDAIGSGMAVMLDGGIRRGTDILKALALGADFVFLGRPFLFAAVAGGEPGVRHAIELLSTEISRDMALLGINDLAKIDPTLIAQSRRDCAEYWRNVMVGRTNNT